MSALAYDQDFYGWTQEQARLLREHRINELDEARRGMYPVATF